MPQRARHSSSIMPPKSMRAAAGGGSAGAGGTHTDSSSSSSNSSHSSRSSTTSSSSGGGSTHSSSSVLPSLTSLSSSIHDVLLDEQGSVTDPDALQQVDPEEYERVKASLLNPPEETQRRQTFEYINRAHIEERELKEMRAKEEQRKEAEAIIAARAPTFFRVLRTTTNASALLTLFIVTAIMVVFPLSTFFLADLIFSSLQWSENARLAASGFLAVGAVNIVAIGFGIYAYLEPEDEETEDVRIDRMTRAQAQRDDFIRSLTRGRVRSMAAWLQLTDQQKGELQGSAASGNARAKKPGRAGAEFNPAQHDGDADEESEEEDVVSSRHVDGKSASSQASSRLANVLSRRSNAAKRS